MLIARRSALMRFLSGFRPDFDECVLCTAILKCIALMAAERRNEVDTLMAEVHA